MVHLADIVGDPACGKDPAVSNDVNIKGSAAVTAAARDAGAERLIFASTCSNYERMVDPTEGVDETAKLAPVSLYAEQKVEIGRWFSERSTAAYSRRVCASRRSTAWHPECGST